VVIRGARGGRAALTVLAVLAVVVAAPLLAQGFRELAGREGADRVVLLSRGYGEPAGRAVVDQVALQFAGGREAACRVVQPGAAGCPVPAAAVAPYEAAVRADWWLVAGYVLAGTGVFGLGALFLYGSGARRVARWCVGGVLLAGAADTVENLALLRGLDTLAGAAQPQGEVPFALATSLAVLKFAVFGPLLPAFVVVGSVLGARRLLRPSRVRRREDADPPEIVRASELDPGTDRRPDIILPPAVADASTATLSATVGQSGADVQQELYTEAGRERAAEVAAATAGGHPQPDLPGPARARWHNAGRVPPGRPPAEVGICASGGGIRSAAVTLGALQALRREVLSRARYLVSVSGGGYMAGAFQLALTRANPEAESLARPGDVFTPGSAEEDHLRRHGKYLADGGREWLTALGVVLRGVAASLGLLTLGVVVIGVGLNAFYRAAPVVDVTALLPRFDPAAGREPAPFPTPPDAVRWTLAVVAAVAVAAWVVVMVGLLASDERLGPVGVARNVFRAAVGVGAVVAVYAVAVPAVVWAMARLTFAIPVESPVPAASLTAAVTTLLTWFGALASTMWRRTERLRASGAKLGLGGLLGRRDRGEVVERQVATGFGQTLIVWTVHAVLTFVFVFVGAWTTAAAHRWPAWLGPVLLAVLVGVGFLIDQTWLGLHPFYRRRLASAFAVRRAHMPDGGTGALAYRSEEPTTLSGYGRRVDGFPQVIFVGAAALSGQSRTPPGRRATAFTMSGDYVGGPDVGGVRTSTLEATCRPALRRDVTVQAAMAVSGAAFASAMGRHAAAVQRLLALSNVRLGTWLPNPAFLAALGRPGAGWRTPRLPGARRLPSQLQEIVGAYPAEGRMLLCTDGGHWASTSARPPSRSCGRERRPSIDVAFADAAPRQALRMRVGHTWPAF
jgi:Patatin-like phospholipase